MSKGIELMMKSLLQMVGIKPEQIQQISTQVIPSLIDAAQTVSEYKNQLDRLESNQRYIIALLRGDIMPVNSEETKVLKVVQNG